MRSEVAELRVRKLEVLPNDIYTLLQAHWDRVDDLSRIERSEKICKRDRDWAGDEMRAYADRLLGLELPGKVRKGT